VRRRAGGARSSLEIVTAEVAAPEASIAALGRPRRRLRRRRSLRLPLQWDGRRLALDGDGRSAIARRQSTDGIRWSPAGTCGSWTMAHTAAQARCATGVAPGPCLVRVAVDGARDHGPWRSRDSRVAVTNPPLYDATSRIAVGYARRTEYSPHSGSTAHSHHSGVDLDTAGHLAWYPDDGTLVAYDHHETEDLVFLDLATGRAGRAPTSSSMQSVVFPTAVDGAVYYVVLIDRDRLVAQAARSPGGQSGHNGPNARSFRRNRVEFARVTRGPCVRESEETASRAPSRPSRVPRCRRATCATAGPRRDRPRCRATRRRPSQW
jgi:hypothetical protein